MRVSSVSLTAPTCSFPAPQLAAKPLPHVAARSTAAPQLRAAAHPAAHSHFRHLGCTSLPAPQLTAKPLLHVAACPAAHSFTSAQLPALAACIAYVFCCVPFAACYPCFVSCPLLAVCHPLFPQLSGPPLTAWVVFSAARPLQLAICRCYQLHARLSCPSYGLIPVFAT